MPVRSLAAYLGLPFPSFWQTPGPGSRPWRCRQSGRSSRPRPCRQVFRSQPAPEAGIRPRMPPPSMLRMVFMDGLFRYGCWVGVSKTGLLWQFFLPENQPSATGQRRKILPPNSGELKSLGSVAVSANANVSLISGSKNRAKFGITNCKYKMFREKQITPNSNEKSTQLFLQTTDRWGLRDVLTEKEDC